MSSFLKSSAKKIWETSLVLGTTWLLSRIPGIREPATRIFWQMIPTGQTVWLGSIALFGSGFAILVVAFFRSDVWLIGSRDRGFVYRVLTGIRESGRQDSFAFRQEWIKSNRPEDKDLRVEERPWNRLP